MENLYGCNAYHRPTQAPFTSQLPIYETEETKPQMDAHIMDYPFILYYGWVRVSTTPMQSARALSTRGQLTPQHQSATFSISRGSRVHSATSPTIIHLARHLPATAQGSRTQPATVQDSRTLIYLCRRMSWPAPCEDLHTT